LTSPGWSYITRSKDAFKAALRIEPINISFAVGVEFSYYQSGLYQGAACASSLNHAMQAVGFGVWTDGVTEYAIIRNQYGVSWGINGYAYVEMTSNNVGVCGLYFDNTFTLVGY
jgi:C1A family cysteine protease